MEGKSEGGKGEGEGKCEGDKGEGKCEGKCEGDKGEGEGEGKGKCEGDKGEGEGKCEGDNGEGKCEGKCEGDKGEGEGEGEGKCEGDKGEGGVVGWHIQEDDKYMKFIFMICILLLVTRSSFSPAPPSPISAVKELNSKSYFFHAIDVYWYYMLLVFLNQSQHLTNSLNIWCLPFLKFLHIVILKNVESVYFKCFVFRHVMCWRDSS